MVPACEALQNQAGRQKVQTGAAVFFGDGGTEKAVIADHAERFVRPPFFTVHPFGKRIYSVECETSGVIEDGLLLFVEGKIRRTSVATQDGLGRGHALVSSQF